LIHHANRLYRQPGQNHTKADYAESQLRLERLEKITAELAELRGQPQITLTRLTQ